MLKVIAGVVIGFMIFGFFIKACTNTGNISGLNEVVIDGSGSVVEIKDSASSHSEINVAPGNNVLVIQNGDTVTYIKDGVKIK